MSKQHPDELRRKAEELFAARDSRIEALERDDLAHLAHELAVHQIELEIQNEELRRTRTLAEEARDRYLDLYDFAPVGYFTLDEHGRIVEANLTGCRLLGAARRDLLQTRFTKFIVKGETDRFYFHRKQVLEGDAKQTCELKMRAVDGGSFDARLESIRTREGRLRVAVIDITERKQAEEALRESEERLRAIYEHGRIGIAVGDLQGRLKYANPAFQNMLGYEEGELVGKNFRAFTVASDLPAENAYVEEILAGKRDHYDIEKRYIRKDGQVIWIALSAAIIRDSEGKPAFGLTMVQDVTERKRAEEGLRELNATLESKVAQRTAELELRARQLQRLMLELSLSEDRERRRIAEVLHDDLQQMLAAAKFHVGLLKKRAAQDPPQQAMAGKVEDMLRDAIEKSRSLSQELSPAVAHRSDLAETLGWLAQQMRARHGLTVRVDAPEETTLQSEAITIFLLKAAREMLFNVSKHAGVNEAGIRVRRHGRYVCMVVSDRGSGFDAREQKETTGFGLFGIRERAELLGGRMRIRSVKGEGSTLYLAVPDEEVIATDADIDREPAGRAARAKRA